MSIVNSKQLAKSIYNITGSFTGSFIGDGNQLYLYRIITGSITASVGTNGNIFEISSGSYNHFIINSSGSFIIKSQADNIMTVVNDTNENIITVKQDKIINFITHSFNPTSSANPGDIWFTSSSLYLGLE